MCDNFGNKRKLAYPERDEYLEEGPCNETQVAKDDNEVPELDELGLVSLAQGLLELLPPNGLADVA